MGALVIKHRNYIIYNHNVYYTNCTNHCAHIGH
jgi:hypothetical protein